MDLIPMPSALLSHFLLAQEMRQQQLGIGHRGRSRQNMSLAIAIFENHAPPYGIWWNSIRIRTTEASGEIYAVPETIRDRFPGPTQCEPHQY